MPGVVVANQPGVYFVDSDGNTLSADDGATISSHEGLLIAGKDGTFMRFMRVASDGTLRIDPTGTTTQPISASALPLPAGAATQTTLATLATETKLEAVRLLLASLDAKDYATETTQATLATETKLEAVRVLLVSLDGKDFATETTLSAADTKLGTIDAVLDSIKDTDGIKKITDQLPAGTNNIGDVDIASALPTGANVIGRTITRSGPKGSSTAADITSKPVDANTEALHVDTVVSGGSSAANQTNGNQKSIVRSGVKGTSVAADITSNPVDANTEALHTSLASWLGSVAPTVGQKVMVDSIPVTMASNQPAIPVSVGAAASEGAVTEYVTDDGLPSGDHDLVVNGTVPKSFTFPAHATRDIVLTGVRLVFSSAFFSFNGDDFGKGGGALTNGVEMKIVANGGIFTATLATLVVNEDFFRLLQFSISQAGATDVMAATLPFQGRVVLEAGSSDKVEVVINDNLTTGARGITYFTGTVYGVLEPL